MTQTIEADFQVDGRDYRLVLAKSPDSLAHSCGPVAGSGAIGPVVSSFWMRTPEALLNSVVNRTGLSYEGELAFDYDEGTTPPREVTLFAHDVEETVDTAFFERFVVEYALACIGAGRKIGLDTGARFQDRLISMRALEK